MKALEEIPVFKKTPEITEKNACTKIYTIAGLKNYMRMNKQTAIVLKKLLDDRRLLMEEFLGVIELLYCISHVNEGLNNSINCLLKRIIGKTWKEWRNDRHKNP